MICAGTDLQWSFAVCTDEMMRGVVVVSCHFNHQTSCTWLMAHQWSSSCRPVYHPSTFFQSGLVTAASLVLQTSHRPAWLFPSLKYLHDIFSHIAAANSRVEPFCGLCLRQVVSGAGRTILQIFSLISSSVVFTLLSSTGFRNPSGTFSWTNGLTAPLMTAIKVVLSVTLGQCSDVGAYLGKVPMCLCHVGQRCHQCRLVLRPAWFALVTFEGIPGLSGSLLGDLP